RGIHERDLRSLRGAGRGAGGLPRSVDLRRCLVLLHRRLDLLVRGDEHLPERGYQLQMRARARNRTERNRGRRDRRHGGELLNRRRSSRGLTLVEMVAAFVIFAIVATVASTLMS